MKPFLSKLGFSLIATTSLMSLARADGARPDFIITDIDDTIKMTHVLSPASAVGSEFFSRRAFSGMSVLYQELNANRVANGLGEPPATFYVSGGFTFLSSFVDSFLDANKFPEPRDVRLRTSIGESTPDHKIAAITQIFNANLDENAICFGDDGEKDPETYHTLKGSFPDRIDAIYIHRIQGRPIYDGEIAYDTAMDIALNEVVAGRLTEEQATWVGKAILADDRENLVLDDSYCPSADSVRVSEQLTGKVQSADLLKLARSVEDEVRKVCIHRAAETARIEQMNKQRDHSPLNDLSRN